MAERIRYAFGHSSIAAFLAARGDGGLVAIIIRQHADDEGLVAELARRFGAGNIEHDEDGMAQDVARIADFIEYPRANIDLPLDIRTTDFQRSVYDAVLKIPFGETTTFLEIASRIGSPGAVRAVGSACTRNPLEFAIPCHRVLRSDGRWSGGGAWGDWRQSVIVGREQAAGAG